MSQHNHHQSPFSGRIFRGVQQPVRIVLVACRLYTRARCRETHPAQRPAEWQKTC